MNINDITNPLKENKDIIVLVELTDSSEVMVLETTDNEFVVISRNLTIKIAIGHKELQDKLSWIGGDIKSFSVVSKKKVEMRIRFWNEN